MHSRAAPKMKFQQCIVSTLLVMVIKSCNCTESLGDSNTLNFTVEPEEPSNSSFCNNTVSTTDSDIIYNFDGIIALDASSIVPNITVTLFFLPGCHTLRKGNIAEISVSTVSVVGGHSNASCVVISNINLEFKKGSTLHLENVTIRDVSFKVYPLNLNRQTVFSITNCDFIGSDSTIIGTNLTLQNSRIINGTNTAMSLFSSTLTFEGNVTFFGNTGEKGGALSLTLSSVNISRGANVTFSHNNASGLGGALFIENPSETLKFIPDSDCFYRLHQYSDNATYTVKFTENYANYGGNHIYGSSLKSECNAATNESSMAGVSSYKIISLGNVFHFEKPGLNTETPESTAVAANPGRICVCDESDVPQCLDSNKVVLGNESRRYPGESFSLSVVLVGGDFGTTIGIVQTRTRYSNQSSYPVCNQESAMSTHQCFHVVTRTKCTRLNYTIHSRNTSELVTLILTTTKSDLVRSLNKTTYKRDISESIDSYNIDGVIDARLLFTPIFINIALKACPKGFSLDTNLSKCQCYAPVKANSGIECDLLSDGGYLSNYSSNIWIGVHTLNASDGSKIILGKRCPFCNKSHFGEPVNLESPSSIDAQCWFNHTGILCGGCRDGHSLAIGTSHCIACDNSKNVGLVLFFAAAGPLLILFIVAVNLTVTQGMINGVIFYANIIWVYESVVFPAESTKILLFLRIFIAWINLDFGIETCFVVGLNAFSKTLLQYVFPLYLWTIVGVIIVGAKHSTKLTRILGSRTVSLLSTLTLLSYMKLLRNARESFSYAHLEYYSSRERTDTVVVWAQDGQLHYGKRPHIIILIAAMIVICLSIPYTLVLIFGKWLREVSCFTRFHPIFDSHFASLKDRHQYWLGVLLVTLSFLYGIKIFILDEELAILVMLITIGLLQFCMSVIQPHKSVAVFVVHSAFLVNLIILSGSILFVGIENGNQTDTNFYATIVSTAVAFAEFCIIVVMLVAKNIPYKRFYHTANRVRYRTIRKAKKLKQLSKSRGENEASVSYVSLRDSILEESLLSK